MKFLGRHSNIHFLDASQVSSRSVLGVDVKTGRRPFTLMRRRRGGFFTYALVFYEHSKYTLNSDFTFSESTNAQISPKLKSRVLRAYLL